MGGYYQRYQKEPLLDEIEPKLFYSSPTGEKNAFAKIIVVAKDGDAGIAYYPSRQQLLNLIRSLIEMLHQTL